MAEEQQRIANLWSGFDSNAHLLRFLAVCVAFIVTISICCFILFWGLGITVASPSIRIGIEGTQTTQDIRQITFARGGLQIQLRTGETFATALVPANKLWVNTNIEVAPGSTIRLAATGSVNLSQPATLDLNRDPGNYNLEGAYHLIDPYGLRIDNRVLRSRPADNLRDEIKLVRGVNLGVLVGAVAPSERALIDEPRARETFTIEASEGQVYRGANRGTLFLAVNDLLWLDSPRAREVWMLSRRPDGSPFTPAETRENIRRAYLPVGAPERLIDERIRWAGDLWDTLSRMGYRNYFYDDNSGYYMVQISVTPPPRD
jgi:hypothetical protein